MGSLIQRPTRVKGEKGDWLIQGPWGRRTMPAMSKNELYQVLHRELIDSGVLPADSRAPSNRYHDHVTGTIMHSSWIAGRWVPDEPFRGATQKASQRCAADTGTAR